MEVIRDGSDKPMTQHGPNHPLYSGPVLMDDLDAPPDPEIIDRKLVVDEAAAVLEITTRFLRYKDCNERKKKEGEWLASYYAYMGAKYAGCEWMIREIFRQVETLIPKLAKPLLGNDELFHMVARQKGYEEAAEGAAAVINDQIKRFGTEAEFHTFIRGWVMYGTYYFLPAWRRFKHVSKKLQQMSGEEETDTWKRKTSEVIVDAPFVEALGPWDVFVHPNVEHVEDSPAAYVVKHVSVSDLKTLVREGYLDGDALEKALKKTQKAMEATLAGISLAQIVSGMRKK